MNNSHMSKKARAELLARSYFDATTTLAQEAELRSLLADPALSSPDIDSARAAMGYTAAMTPPRRRPRRIAIPAMRVAAAVAVAVTIAVGLLVNKAPGADGDYIAYIDGRPTDDSRVALALMDADLDAIAIADASLDATVADELSLMSDILSEQNDN